MNASARPGRGPPSLASPIHFPTPGAPHPPYPPDTATKSLSPPWAGTLTSTLKRCSRWQPCMSTWPSRQARASPQCPSSPLTPSWIASARVGAEAVDHWQDLYHLLARANGDLFESRGGARGPRCKGPQAPSATPMQWAGAQHPARPALPHATRCQAQLCLPLSALHLPCPMRALRTCVPRPCRVLPPSVLSQDWPDRQDCNPQVHNCLLHQGERSLALQPQQLPK